VTIFYGPAIAHTARMALREHREAMLGVGAAIGLVFTVYVLRKLFDRRRGVKFPLEEETAAAADEPQDGDPTLIT
jgi:hypothetical protein